MMVNALLFYHSLPFLWWSFSSSLFYSHSFPFPYSPIFTHFSCHHNTQHYSPGPLLNISLISIYNHAWVGSTSFWLCKILFPCLHSRFWFPHSWKKSFHSWQYSSFLLNLTEISNKNFLSLRLTLSTTWQ